MVRKVWELSHQVPKVRYYREWVEMVFKFLLEIIRTLDSSVEQMLAIIVHFRAG